jgi:hypothetical protein
LGGGGLQPTPPPVAMSLFTDVNVKVALSPQLF